MTNSAFAPQQQRAATQIIPPNSSSVPGALRARFFNHARRLRLEKLLCLELYRTRSPDGRFKPLLDPGGGFASEALKPPRGGFRIETVVAQPLRK
jgi:hypothetical protein